jgi:hypothetical protein
LRQYAYQEANMSDEQWPGSPDPDLPAVGMIEVVGTIEHPRDASSDVAIKTFRAWLVKRHSAARIAVRSVSRPDALGRAYVSVTPAVPLIKEPGGLGTADQAVRLHREEEIIGRMWRKMVSWGN